MEITRRKFSQMTLMGILASSLSVFAAEDTHLSVIKPLFRAKQSTAGLEVALTLENMSQESVEILAWQGWSHGVRLHLRSGGEWIQMVSTEKRELSEFEQRSRAGPRPQWKSLHPLTKENFGTFRSEKASQLKDSSAQLKLTLVSQRGELQFPPITVPVVSS